MRPTLILWSLLLAGLALARSAHAQNPDVYEPASAAHRPGRWSMQFQVAENFRFSAFEGAGLAMTRNAGTNAAWRFGVSLDGVFRDGARTTTTTTDSSSAQDVFPIDQYEHSVRFDLVHLHRTQPARRVGLEIGVGPSVYLLRYGDEFEDSNEFGSSQRESRASLSRYGLTGRLGVEVFLARALSVHAHYGAFAGYQLETSTQLFQATSAGGSSSDSVFEVQRHRWFLSNEGVSLGISVYL